MSTELQDLLQDALLNNSYDYDVLHMSLKKDLYSSYSYLYTMQKAKVEYEEHFYYSNDTESRNSKHIGHLYVDKYLYANFDIDYDLINVWDREEFRTSQFYHHRFTVENIVHNPDIFKKMPVIMIDDKVIWDYYITVTKDCTTITLPFRRSFVIDLTRNPQTDDIVYIDHKIQVFVVDNIFYQRFEANRNSIYLSVVNKTFKISKEGLRLTIADNIKDSVTKEYLDKYHVNSVDELTNTLRNALNRRIARIQKDSSLYQKCIGIMMASFHIPNNAGNAYELGTMLIPMRDEGEFLVGDLSDDLVSLLSSTTINFYTSLVYFNRLICHKFYDGKSYTRATSVGADLLVLEDKPYAPYSMPVPVEDFLVFRKKHNEDGYYVMKNTDMIEMHYPNIYRIKDEELENHDIYKVYYFYYRDDNLSYTPMFDFYFRFIRDLYSETTTFEEMINNIYYDRNLPSSLSSEEYEKFKEVFQKIYDYQYFVHQYGDIDFTERYLKIPGNEDKEPIEYKDEIFKSWLRIYPNYLRDYVLDQNKISKAYHLFTNTIDLQSRLRWDTTPELGDPVHRFDEARYVFALSNDSVYPRDLHARVFVDGIFIGDVYQRRRLYMDYFYIPVDKVTNDSYIEIEIFPEFSFEKDILFTSMEDEAQVITLEPEEDIWPTHIDVFLQDEHHRYDKNFLDFTLHTERGNIELVSTDPGKKPIKFTRLKVFDIKPKDEMILNTPVKFRIAKVPHYLPIRLEHDGFPCIEFVGDECNCCYNPRYLRVFTEDGRIYPRNKYKMVTTLDKPRIYFLDEFHKGDAIYIDVTPFRYRRVLYMEELPSDNPIIDLKDYINKPFDIRYFDVYLNGRKLSLPNVFSISPWEIALVNLKSIYNLEIFEKERDWEYFGLDYHDDMYYFTFDDLLNSGAVTEEEKNKLIKWMIDTAKDRRVNIYPNTNDEEKIDYEEDDGEEFIYRIFYYNELLPKTYVNPDRKQLGSILIEDEYDDIYNTYLKSPAEQSSCHEINVRRRRYLNSIMLDPDIIFRGTNPDHPMKVYMVGHPDETVEQEILDEHIEINNNSDIDE